MSGASPAKVGFCFACTEIGDGDYLRAFLLAGEGNDVVAAGGRP